MAIGDLLIKGNVSNIFKVCKIFNERIKDNKMSIVNNLEDNPTTHVNLKSGLNRALDIAFTNFPEKVTNFVIEYDLEITPYSKIFKNNSYLLYFTDH